MFCRLCDAPTPVDQFFNAFSFRSSLLSSWIQSDLADLKIYWAFRIFDFDNDNKISQDDMEIAVALMAGDRRVTREQIASIAAAVIREGDQDDSNSISRTEFKRVLQRVPDFQWYASVDCFFCILSSNVLWCDCPFTAHLCLILAALFHPLCVQALLDPRMRLRVAASQLYIYMLQHLIVYLLSFCRVYIH